MYDFSATSSKGSPTSVGKIMWDGSPLQKSLTKDTPLPEARKIARDFHSARAASQHGHWKPARLPDELLAKHEVIGFFVPNPNWDEPESLDSLLLGAQVSRPIVLCLPRIDLEAGTMNFFEIRDPVKDLVMNKKFGVLEPKASPRRKRNPTLLVIPCLMSDPYGHRIGRGRGYYDRYLAQHPEVKDRVGCMHTTSIIEKGLPSHWLQVHDQTLSAYVTEKGFHSLLSTPQK